MYEKSIGIQLYRNCIQMYTHQGFDPNRMLLDNFSSAMKIEKSYRYVFGYIAMDKIYLYSSMLYIVLGI